MVGRGSGLPGSPVPAREIERRANLPDGWIDQHTMVHVRHECTSPETLLTMAKRAAERALSDAKLDWSAIDLIIDGSTSRYQPIPCNAAVFQAAIGPAAEGIACFDVHATCLGFLTAVNVANSLLAVGDTGYRVAADDPAGFHFTGFHLPEQRHRTLAPLAAQAAGWQLPLSFDERAVVVHQR